MNNRQKDYYSILNELKINKNKEFIFKPSGKLIICLIEFRIQQEIENVMAAVLKVYNPDEIGIAVMYGNKNKDYIESLFKQWKNMIFIHKPYDNIDRKIYSQLLKQPEFYENFKAWSHVLIYQTDALIFRKIDDIYFNYDYIGAPWKHTNQCAKYNAGNGGFSLRNVKSCIKYCENHRNLLVSQISPGNEDIFFCSNKLFNYPPFNTLIHRMFSVERVPSNNPIGAHQIFHCYDMDKEKWNNFICYMKKCLLENYKPEIKIQEVIKLSNQELEDRENYKANIKEMNLNKVEEKLNQKQKIGSFEAMLVHKSKNCWEIECDNDYEILFCRNNNPESYVKTHKVSCFNKSVIHKKAEGCYYLHKDDYIYLVFYPGFPNGGECWADINAGKGHYNHCRDLPINGAIILKSKVNKSEIIKPKLNDSIDHISDKILAFDLYTGVGYYNQLFSLETAVYLANISNRYLILNIRHPLVACGRPSRDYGTILDYVSNDFKKYLIGLESRIYFNFIENSHYELNLPNRLSNCIILDEEIVHSKDVNDFSHYRTIVSGKKFYKQLFGDDKLVYFSKSNASRMFTNFYTSDKNYELMNQIAYSLSSYNEVLHNICLALDPLLDENFIALHLRLGDWHKEINKEPNHTIMNNIIEWLKLNNTENWPLYIMTDKNDNPLFESLRNYTLKFVDKMITDDIKNELKKHYKNTTVAEFTLQKYILEKSTIFLGTQGSTVSSHLNYMCYINNKPYEHVVDSNCNTFNSKTLKHDEINNNKYSWKRKNYMGGHPLSWSLFFCDNIIKKEQLNEYDMNSEGIQLIINDIDPNKTIKGEMSEKKINNIKEIQINDSTPFISVDIWIKLSDVVIDASYKNKIDNYNYKNEIEEAFKKNNPVIFLKTDLLPNYIDILNSFTERFTLITASNDDHCPPYLYYPPDDELHKDLKLKVDKLLNSKHLFMWYAKNPAIKHMKLKPYPIGPKWQWKTTRFFGENKNKHLQIFNKYCLNPLKMMLDSKLKTELLYFNFTCPTTNKPLFKFHQRMRNNVKDIFLKKGFQWNENEEFEDYIKTLSKYKFCLAPPGRGIDTHRCWEALMVGTIPIVFSSSLNDLYENLPVIVVDDWNIINEEYLHQEYKNILQGTYNFEKLYANFWFNRHLNYSKV